MTSGQAFYEFLYEWVASVVPNGVAVIQAFQNIEQPVKPFIAIDDEASWELYGRMDVTQEELVAEVITTYTVSPSFWEVGGNGDNLRVLAESLELSTTKTMFKDAGIGILRKGPIISVPWASTETEFVRQKRMEVSFSVSSKTTDTIVSIETVELVPHIGGT